VLEDQRFAAVGLFFLPVLSKWLTVISMGLIISGGFVSKAPMYVMRGEMPIRSMTHYMTCWWLKYGVRMVGKWMIPSVPFKEAYFLETRPPT
jgi:hypothetical protein